MRAGARGGRAGGFPANTVTAGPNAEVGRLQRPGSPWCHRPGPPPRRHHRLVVPDFEGYVHGFTQSPAFGGDPASRLCLRGSQWFGATVGSSSSYVRVLAATSFSVPLPLGVACGGRPWAGVPWVRVHVCGRVSGRTVVVGAGRAAGGPDAPRWPCGADTRPVWAAVCRQSCKLLHVTSWAGRAHFTCPLFW